ncbi:hypothetical protein P7C70_g3993, partial [Phenoliferia sp. Uapishka_3]
MASEQLTFQPPVDVGIHLTPEMPTYIHHYETIISGFPTFTISKFRGSSAQIEVKYTELYDGLAAPNSDGPYMFSSGLSNNFRVETFNISKLGTLESFFIQGSVLHQSISLISGQGVTFSGFGVRSTVSNNPLDSLPGSFNCSNSVFSDIWALGPNSIRHACVRNGTQRSTWELVPDEGVLIRGQRAARSAHISKNLPTSYTMSFETKIARGGTGWVVDTALGGAGIWMFLMSDLPKDSTYANHKHDLLPANSLVLGTGFGLVREITNGGHRFEVIPIRNLVVKENVWYNITTTVEDRHIYSVLIDSHLVLSNLDIHDYDDVPDFHPFFGNATVGLGPWQDQAAIFRELKLFHPDGSNFYSNAMDSEEVFAEFGVASNEYDVCLDGASRDRLIWTGDFYTAAWTIAVSTGELEFIRGTVDFSFDYRLQNGAIPTSNPMGIRVEDAAQWSAAPSTLYTDYSMDLLNIAYEYYFITGDLSYIHGRWLDIRDLVSYILTFLDPSTQLLNTMIFKGSSEGTSSGCMLVYTLNNLAKLADALGDVPTAKTYRKQAKETAKAVQTLLFNNETGTFKTSIENDAFAYIDLAWTILSGVATKAQIKSQLRHLEKLKYKIAYLADSNTGGSDSTVFAPYLSSYLLEALLQASAEDEAEFLLSGIFAAMATPSKDFSGSAWEYVVRISHDLTSSLLIFT